MTHDLTLSGRLEVMKVSHQRLQLNQYGLPASVYRPDLLPLQMEEIDTNTDAGALAWDNAQVNISYAEGFPTIDGFPIWERLDFESLEVFEAFQMYIKMQDELEGNRAMYLLYQRQDKYSREELNDMFYAYYWPQRALAYDLYQSTVTDRRRDHRTTKLDDVLYERARDLTDLAIDYIESEEFEDLMTPKLALDLYNTGIKHQRLALGLNPTAPNIAKTEGGDRTLEISTKMRQMTNVETKIEGGEETETHMREAILEDETTIEQAQELIIRITESGRNG